MEADSPSDVRASELQKREAANISDDHELLDRYDDSKVDWRMLKEQAEQRSWEMYRRLEQRGMCLEVVRTIKEEKEMDSNFRISDDSELMEYYYKRGHGRTCPYNLLRANRDQYGELILPHLDDTTEEMFLGCWNGLEKDQQYDRLTQTLKKQMNLKYDYMNEHLSYAKAFVEENKLNLLDHEDVETCVYDVVHQNVVIRRLEDMRSFGYYLMKQDVQEISTAHQKKFLAKAKKNYPFVDDYGFDDVLAMVFPCGWKRSEKRAKEEIERYFMWHKKFYQRNPTPVGDYIELKLRIAKEIGIIKEGKDGLFVDKFSSASEN